MERVSTLIKQMAIFRFFITEKKRVLKDQYTKAGMKDPELTTTLAAKIDKLKITGATEADPSFYQTLKENNLLNTTISAGTEAGIAMTVEAKRIQAEIEKTKTSMDFGDIRGDITYDYDSQSITSRGQKTKVEINKSGKYKINGLGLTFPNLKALLWIANISNRFMNEYGANLLQRTANNNPLSGNKLVWHNVLAYP